MQKMKKKVQKLEIDHKNRLEINFKSKRNFILQ